MHRSTRANMWGRDPLMHLATMCHARSPSSPRCPECWVRLSTLNITINWDSYKPIIVTFIAYDGSFKLLWENHRLHRWYSLHSIHSWNKPSNIHLPAQKYQLRLLMLRQRNEIPYIASNRRLRPTSIQLSQTCQHDRYIGQHYTQ